MSANRSSQLLHVASLSEKGTLSPWRFDPIGS